MKTLDIKGAADALKVHTNTILDLAGRGVLPGAKIGRSWVFREEDIDAYLIRQIKEQSARRALPKFSREVGGPKIRVSL